MASSGTALFYRYFIVVLVQQHGPRRSWKLQKSSLIKEARKILILNSALRQTPLVFIPEKTEVNEFPAFYRTKWFISVITKSRL
jgi:hypothetical protein